MINFTDENPNKLTEKGQRDFEKKAEELQDIFLSNREFLVEWSERQNYGIRSKQIGSLIILLMKINPMLHSKRS